MIMELTIGMEEPSDNACSISSYHLKLAQIEDIIIMQQRLIGVPKIFDNMDLIIGLQTYRTKVAYT